NAAAHDRADSDIDTATEARLARAIPELQRTGSDGEPGKRVVQGLNSVIAKPWDYIREPLRGARYRYFGTGFDAIVTSDGSVRYRNRDGLQFMMGQVRSTEDDDEVIQTYGLGFRDGLLPKSMGRDAHASERRAFLERTRALRELLHERALRQALARAEAHLTKQLAAVALKLEVGDDRRGRAELFALWDECAEDEVGAKARSRIEAFAREHCGLESSARFADAELVALNRARLSKQPFDPYRRYSDAGDPLTDQDASAP
ncbi:MAG TPA: hypothetical protein VFZ61_09100, partial [Polyangiales bacterium]